MYRCVPTTAVAGRGLHPAPVTGAGAVYHNRREALGPDCGDLTAVVHTGLPETLSFRAAAAGCGRPGAARGGQGGEGRCWLVSEDEKPVYEDGEAPTAL